jgi:site-specific DNA-adenine methylase
MIGPFMKCFGSKWSAAKRGEYPAPDYEVIYEPFAGGAGYSCRHHERSVILREAHQELSRLWSWLIIATEDSIREIPILRPGTNILDAELSIGQATLVKWWQRTNNHGTVTWTVSPWGNSPGQWTQNTRSRIAEEVSAIRHWKVSLWESAKNATLFIDPPYVYNYQYGFRCRQVFYEQLASQIASSKSDSCQIIACEALGKNGEIPTWLPFSHSHRQVTSRRTKGSHHHSNELIYHYSPKLMMQEAP